VSHHRGRRLLEWLPPLLFIALAVCLFPSVGTDDSYLSYWAAHALSSTGEIVNYNGARIEQSSSLLHVLILAALAKVIPLSIPTIADLVGLLCGALTVRLTQRLAALVDERLPFFAGLLMALSTPLLYWSMAGLETPIAAAVVAGLVLSLATWMTGTSAAHARPRLPFILVLVGAYLLVRPEAIAVIVSTLVGVLVVLLARRRGSGDPEERCALMARRVGQVLIAALVLAGAIAALRLAYFGSPVPQPVLAKTAGVAIQEGIAYVQAHAFGRYDAVMWILATAGVALTVFRSVARPSLSPAAMLASLFVIAQFAFVLTAGGDWMPYGRFLIVMLPGAAILGLLFIRELRPALLAPVAAMLVALQLWPLANIVRFHLLLPLWAFERTADQLPEFSWLEYLNAEHHRDIPAIVALRDVVDQLRDGRGRPVSILSGQLGMVPYYVARTHGGDIRLLDRFALSTTDFASCPVTSGLPRDSFGLRLDYASFMRSRADLREICGLGDPDVIFDLTNALRRLGGDSRDRLEESGYALVYRNAARFVAVRRDVAHFVKTGRINDQTGPDAPPGPRKPGPETGR
jgi:hypothetical protein